jgi:hypothetical protein
LDCLFQRRFHLATERLDLLLDTEPVALGDLYQYHLQIETPRSNLSEAIKWLNVSYVSWFNREGALRDDWRQIGRWKKCLKDPVKS